MLGSGLAARVPDMDLRDSPAEARFRADLRGWLRHSLAGLDSGDQHRPGRWDPGAVRTFTTLLHQARYAGLTWPVEFGGRGLPLTYQAIYLEEAVAADAPEHLGVIGLGVVGPTLLAHGTPAQKHRYLPRILSGELVFCQGFSEPEAGSDLAAVGTRARPDGDGFVVTGHKLWSSYAHLADECLLLVRTGPAGNGHDGLTCLLLDMRSPGVRVRPIRQLTGEAEFNEIVLDQVRVPAGRVLGAVGNGWRVALTGLANERGTLGFTLAARLSLALRRLLETVRQVGAENDPLVRDRLAGLAVDVAGLRWTAARMLGNGDGGRLPGPESSYLKLVWSHTHQRLTTLALDLLGPQAAVTGPDAFWDGHWQHQQLRSLGNTIEGGTSQIQRGIIAERVLGLPRSR